MMAFTLLRWRPRTLESGLAVKTCLLPAHFDREIDPIMQTAPLTDEGRAMILGDDYSPDTPGHARAYGVQRPSVASGYEPCGLVVLHNWVIPGTRLSDAPSRLLLGDEIDVSMPAVVERVTFRTTVLTRKGVVSLRGKYELRAWWYLNRMPAAEDLPRTLIMEPEDLAFLAELDL